MRLYLITTKYNLWIIRATDSLTAKRIIDPQGYIEQQTKISIAELESDAYQGIVYHRLLSTV